MSKAGKITRRVLLIGTAAITGGVVFGYYKYKQPYPNPLLEDLPDGEAALTPYVKIDAKGITLITPHADIGQGVRSMQAALIAEELDVELDQIMTSPGKPAPAYYNTAMADEIAPFLPWDKSFAANTTRSAMGVMFKFLALQGTGGSSSVPDSFEKLRIAGAVARETLKKAAAQKKDIDVSKLKTEKAAVVLPDGARIPYTKLAADAAKISPVTEISLRPPEDWRLVGKPMQRIDVVSKSTGTLKFGIDQHIEGMLHATVKINPRQGGEIKNYDASEALKMPGVKKVIPLKGGVAVVAKDTWSAFKAANIIKCEWGKAPYPAEQEDHWKAVAASFTKDHLEDAWRSEGDVALSLKQTKKDTSSIISAEYKAPYLAHAPLEPLCAIVKITDNRADIWTASQVPGYVVLNVAHIAGLKSTQVHLHNQYAGGSFGHRLEDEHVKQAAKIALEMKGTPIKLTYSREEDLAHDFPRQIAMARMQGAHKDGKVEICDMQIAMVSSTRSQMSRQNISAPGPDGQIVAGAWNLPYTIPNFRVRGYAVPELAPVSSWRSVGASVNGYFADCFIDELIHAAGADPLKGRLRLMNNDLAKKVLLTVETISGWKGPKISDNRARGVAFVESFGVPCAEVIEITQTPSGIRIDKVYVAAEVGKIIDPVNFDNLVKGGVIWGLGHAMNCEISYSDGMAEQTNYDSFEGMRINQCPEILVKGLENGDKVKGIGEPPVPPAAPALANAIFALTGKRLREMPFNKHIKFADNFSI